MIRRAIGSAQAWARMAAVAIVSRLARPTSGWPYLLATTSPCSVMRRPGATAPQGRAWMASKLDPPPRPTAPPRPWKKRVLIPCRSPSAVSRAMAVRISQVEVT